MAKELYLYSGIYDFTAEELISSLEEFKSEDITLRMNTPGGSVFSGWGIIGKMGEHEGKIKVKVDGIAASMGAVIVVFADEVEALDVSRIMIHRADMYVSSPEQQALLDSVNKDLKAKLLTKIDPEKLKQLKGITIDELFNPEKRIDLWLTAKEAKELKLVTKIVKVKPEEAKAVNDAMYKVAAELKDPDNQSNKKTVIKMTTIEELKAQHPALFALAVEAGFAQGVAKERDRAGAWLAFAKIDMEAVVKGIKEGKDMSQTESAELTVKALTTQGLQKITNDNPPPVTTTEVTPPTAEKAKKIQDFEADLKSSLSKLK
jgi:ATP-dependent protease ClpP protease subunit